MKTALFIALVSAPLSIRHGTLSWLLHTQQKFSNSSHVARFRYIALICTDSGLSLCLLSFHNVLISGCCAGSCPHPEASQDRPGAAVTVSRIVAARNSGHPEPYTGTRTVLVCSSRPRGSAAAAGGGTAPRTSPLRWRGPQGTRNDPDNFGSAAGGFTQALGGWAGSKLERVEFPVFTPPCVGRDPRGPTTSPAI